MQKLGKVKVSNFLEVCHEFIFLHQLNHKANCVPTFAYCELSQQNLRV